MAGIDLRILVDLAENGPEIGYQIHKRIEEKKSTVYDHLYSLRKQGYIEAVELDEVSHPLGQTEYRLLLAGLTAVFLGVVPEASLPCFAARRAAHPSYILKWFGRGNEFESIVNHWKHLLPDVLGKWAYLAETAHEATAIGHLRYASEHYMDTKYLGPVDPTEVGVRRAFTKAFYDIVPQIPPPEWERNHDTASVEKWVQALKNDPDLSSFVIENKERMKKQAEQLQYYLAILSR